MVIILYVFDAYNLSYKSVNSILSLFLIRISLSDRMMSEEGKDVVYFS